MTAPVYTRDILRLAASLESPHELDRTDGRAELRAPTCGSIIATAVMMEGDRVADVSQRVSACAFGQASAALLARSAAGKSRGEIAGALTKLADWLGGRRDDPGGWPDLTLLMPALPKAGRHGAILLPFRALLAAIDDSR